MNCFAALKLACAPLGACFQQVLLQRASAAATANGTTSRRPPARLSGERSGGPSFRMCCLVLRPLLVLTATRRCRSSAWCFGRTSCLGLVRTFCGTCVFSRPVTQAGLTKNMRLCQVQHLTAVAEQVVELMTARSGHLCLLWTCCSWSVRAWLAALRKAALFNPTLQPPGRK